MELCFILLKNGSKEVVLVSNTIKVGRAKEIIRSLIRKNLKHPVLLLGAPGIGKTSILRELAEEEFGSSEDWPEGNYLNVELSTREVPDIQGFPLVKPSGEVVWISLIDFPTEGKGIINFDEINLPKDQGVIRACYRWIHERQVGKRKLGDGWFIIATGNRVTDKCFVNTLPAALNNRFTIYEVECGLDDWKNWAFKAGIAADVIGFLNWKPEALFKFDPERYAPEDPFPTPRSWEKVSDKIKAGLTDFDIIAGDIGEGMASEFCEYIHVKDSLPDIDEILEGKNVVPDRPDLLHVVCSSMVVKTKEKQEYADRLVEYATMLPAEFAALLVKDAIRAEIPVQKTKQFKKFASKFKDVIL
jgi:DNA polymerase III delta prime subunit